MKVVREDIDEKFTQDSDPIYDMGIGMKNVKKWIKEHKNCFEYAFGKGEGKCTINDDFSIDVQGDVRLDEELDGNFPEYIQFNKVSGWFSIDNNNMTSLRGCPYFVGKDFYCSNNDLSSLEYAPKQVGRNFYCDNNRKRFLSKYIETLSKISGAIYN